MTEGYLWLKVTLFFHGRSHYLRDARRKIVFGNRAARSSNGSRDRDAKASSAEISSRHGFTAERIPLDLEAIEAMDVRGSGTRSFLSNFLSERRAAASSGRFSGGGLIGSVSRRKIVERARRAVAEGGTIDF